MCELSKTQGLASENALFPAIADESVRGSEVSRRESRKQGDPHTAGVFIRTDKRDEARSAHVFG